MIVRLAVVVLAGISMRLISPPTGWYALHWFNLVPVFWAMRPKENKANAWLMFAFGYSLVATNYSWVKESIIHFSNLPVPLAWACVFGYALISAPPFWLLGYSVHWFKERVGVFWIWIIPAVQVGLEFVWPALFPYYHGALFYRSTWSWQWLSLLASQG